MTNRYEGVLLELLRYGTVKQQMDILYAHIEQVDQGMLTEVINDDRFDEFYVDMIKSVIKSKVDQR